MNKYYIQKFKNLSLDGTLLPIGRISFPLLTNLNSCRTSEQFGMMLKNIASELPFKINNWPSFGEYKEDSFNVIISDLKKQLAYCERGRIDIRYDCKNGPLLAYRILKTSGLPYTPFSLQLSSTLDPIDDQRLLLWIRNSCEIFQMFEVNSQFGYIAVFENTLWMCDELVRMGLCSEQSEAFKNSEYLICGLMLSGLKRSFAEQIISKLANDSK